MAVIRDRKGTVHRVACLHRHAHTQGSSTMECSVWEVKTGTETAFDLQILLDGDALRTWSHNNPELPFCPGAELPEPFGTRRFGGALGIVETVLHATHVERDSRVVVDSQGQITLVDGLESVALRDDAGASIRIELALPPGARAL